MRERQDRPAAKKFFQAVGLLALALVSVYIIVQCFVIFRQSYKTETAIRYTMAESVRLSGVVAFDSVDVAGSGNFFLIGAVVIPKIIQNFRLTV